MHIMKQNKTFALLVLAGAASSRLQAAAVEPVTTEGIHNAVARAVPLLQHSQTHWFKTQTCGSCHHSAMPAMALMLAREHGVKIDEEAARQAFSMSFSSLTNPDQAIQGSQAIDPASSDTYRMVAAHAAGYPRNTAAAAIAHIMASRQSLDGRWRTADVRPPQTGSEFTTTALAVRSLQLYMPDEFAQEKAERVARAGAWLERQTPRSTEDRTFQLLGIHWAGTAQSVRITAVQALLAEQRPDGGWAQLPSRGSDAYATGEALVALHQAGGIPVDHGAYRKGLRFLLGSQTPDGSWLVQSRIHDNAPVSPPYFETGFPNGKNQFASASGTSWAVMALSLALPKSSVNPFAVGAAEPPEPVWVRTALFGSASELGALLDKGLDPNSKTTQGTTVLMMAAASAEKVKVLIDRGADVNAKAKSGYTPLMVAASYGNAFEAARQLVDAGALMNMKGKDKTRMNASPLLHAVVSGESEKVRMLLAHGADPNQWTIVFDIFPATPLMIAVGFGYEPIIKDLVRAGADLHVEDADGVNQVASAALNGDANTVRVLAELGADVNHIDKRGMTPLIWASTLEHANAKLVENLLAAGADPKITGKNGVTAVSQAEKYSNREALAALQRAGTH
jgi:ankyrin repeat protein